MIKYGGFDLEPGFYAHVNGVLCQCVGIIDSPACMFKEVESGETSVVVIGSLNWNDGVKAVPTLKEGQS